MKLDLIKSTKYREKETFNHLTTVLMCMFGELERLSPFYKQNIDITVIESFPEDPFKMGSTRFYTNGFKDIRMRAWGYDNYEGGYTFEFTMNHELCHYHFPEHSEEQCDVFADSMINFVNSLY